MSPVLDLDRKHPPFWLRLMAGLYRTAVRGRLDLYRRGLLKSRRLPVRVISVGNLTVGGTGKTPAVVMIARMLREKGFSPAVLTRGYKGKNREAVRAVSDGRNILIGPEEAGDEACLLAGLLPGVPVLIGPRRLLTGQRAIDEFRADVLVLDDGYQHLALDRDVNLLLLDADKPWANGWLLPAGRLREPPRAATRATAFVLTRAAGPCPDVLKELETEFPNRPVFTARHRPTLVRDLKGENREAPESLSGRRIIAFCGLARPDVFKKTLKELGAEVVDLIKWPDHYQPRPADLESVMDRAGAANVGMCLTTAKDAVKLAGRFDRLLSNRKPAMRVLEVEMELLDKKDEFRELITKGERNKSC